ncbi:hypothetical protein DPX16_18967 [Anabarilius grahami]|uniref:Uncharacterized protein n=1 Tax=Anabarilius grahami TaxID=495550 RepID=A0A3N0YLV1_ANAGA|nr:hypothetical protein DPX16_18967 [Anabarilius grahami]
MPGKLRDEVQLDPDADRQTTTTTTKTKIQENQESKKQDTRHKELNYSKGTLALKILPVILLPPVSKIDHKTFRPTVQEARTSFIDVQPLKKAVLLAGNGAFLSIKKPFSRPVRGPPSKRGDFVDESCTHYGKMTISELRSRLSLSAAASSSNPPQRVASGSGSGDLRITVSALPLGNQPPRNPHSSCTSQPVELPGESSGPSQRCAPSVSFGAPPDDRMSIAASEGDRVGAVASFGNGNCPIRIRR